ncbi:FAD/FMN-containing dehydrogenase/Fe-S oxidoreductase [Spinactinospora alkalitolerans]|uniref:FAD/FMN-containing dehydrogenase/Fe-S oxidoreductase n=1 Tax=Spinactinospora alkalitolerans TaxID=687207 RepID=A0A852TZD9_9ACTN|nr:FAD-binding and (Fe-S)-binding domain-containing protein [Spinactinospora alkalitolerans]NYE48143.1 FAD/FMN-containing dehydrogenase/Fe-S oxidoreductase [Spinactinospora alkalitolerans]
MTVDLPAPTSHRDAPPLVDVDALIRDLTARVDGEIRFDTGSRAAYATTGSNYRQVPIGVVVPRTVEAGAEAVAVCREHDAPVLSRGGGTSLAGQCCNVAVVIDWTKYCNRVLEVDADARTAVVEPGIVLDVLNARLSEEAGLIFGPKPSTHGQCAIGGMIGNNSCGSTAQAYGKTVDNVVRLEVLTYDGCRMWVGATSEEECERIIAAGGRRAEIYRGLRELRDRHAMAVRRRFPDIPRRVSGYNLDSLLPENGFDLAGALVGSEGTLVTVLRAELRLVSEPAAKALVLCGYPDIFTAADAVPEVAEHRPFALEGMDDKLIGYERRKHLNPEALKWLPEGSGWLMVQFGGDDRDEACEQARGFMDAVSGSEHAPTTRFYDDPAEQEQLWQVREAGLGATARVPAEADTWEGWEDSAVPPERFGDYLRDLHALMEEFDYAERSSLYGHFGHGCLHTRIPFDLITTEGIANYRAFVERAADLVVSYGGSFSGEHGDGQSRAELWPKMFGEELMPAFAEFKRIFDPKDRMNPGKLIAPDGDGPNRLDENLRLGTDYRPATPDTYFGYPHDDGSVARAALRCVSVGKCRQESGGVMCPSYRVTREEEHSTRGRARLLFEMLRGDAIGDGWRSREVNDALDLCLACKGCKTDCPVNVDMATYKAEFLAHHYAGRLRPAAHYAMGWLPVWARAASLAPGAVNALSGRPSLARAGKRIGGVARERPIPAFSPVRFSDAFRRRGPRGDGERGEVVLWPDTFTDNFHPAVGAAAVRILESAGFRVRVPRRTLCCGLTWISTGQLGTARRVLQRTVTALRDDIRSGTPIVGLEPSCTSVFRADAPELFPHDRDVDRLRNQTFTLAEFLNRRAPDWEPPRLERAAVAQPHCHQHAVLGFDEDAALLERTGAQVDVLDAGCCGLAGNFGFEDGHYAVSMACAEDGLLPAVRGADPEAFVLADGFSCRTQIEHAGVGREAVHLAEALDLALRGAAPRRAPERAATRFAPPRRAPRYDLQELREEAMEAGRPRRSGTHTGRAHS